MNDTNTQEEKLEKLFGILLNEKEHMLNAIDNEYVQEQETLDRFEDLLKLFPDVINQEYEKKYLLHFATHSRLVGFVKLLLQWGANPNVKDHPDTSKNGNYPVLYASRKGLVEMMEVFLEANDNDKTVDFSVKDKLVHHILFYYIIKEILIVILNCREILYYTNSSDRYHSIHMRRKTLNCSRSFGKCHMFTLIWFK